MTGYEATGGLTDKAREWHDENARQNDENEGVPVEDLDWKLPVEEANAILNPDPSPEDAAKLDEVRAKIYESHHPTADADGTESEELEEKTAA